jgi:hypothetical protein
MEATIEMKLTPDELWLIRKLRATQRVGYEMHTRDARFYFWTMGAQPDGELLSKLIAPTPEEAADAFLNIYIPFDEAVAYHTKIHGEESKGRWYASVYGGGGLVKRSAVEPKARIERGESVDLVSAERFTYGVVEWIDKDSVHGFEVLAPTDTQQFADQVQALGAKRITVYDVLVQMGDNTWDVANYVRDNPRLTSEISEGEKNA